MSLLVEPPGAGAGTHVLLIGVGQYPRLLGGTPPLFLQHENMGQLSSPPLSARALAKWFLTTYNNPGRPLHSLELLLSDAQGSSFSMPNGDQRPVDRATFASTEHAVLDWKRRGDSDEDNLMILYFCGHGIASGSQTTLLTEDFGTLPEAPLKHSVDFNGLYLGMDKCKARSQCFLIDACRVASGALLEAFGYSGDPIIYGSARHAAVRRAAPVYYATMPGAQAYGRPNHCSFFAEALLKALAGAGSDDLDGEGDWRVQTDVLNRGIHHLLRRAVERTAAEAQLSMVDQLIRFAVHHLQGPPTVPVEVTCNPESDNQYAVLAYSGNARQDRRDQPQAEDWDLDLEMGRYEFSAELQPPRSGQGQAVVDVAPPYRPVRIQVP